ncbi:putative coactivator CBP, KIX domain-containing protein [Lupinus albus]|uniref:Putative coactivator CBP, KIX domain-containing protein n=1 Tax=Lupinus albus TaxID=3870 RepID=A0A6A4NAN2_LUPAL|nr:putative coactivator CBP, KIX domain-containing protein [Lupinus albus]
MDTDNWRLNQSTEPNMDTSDWRGQLQPESRQRIVNKIMDTLKRHLPVSGQEGLHELRKIAQRFEEKIFTAATSQSDYLRKISLKMLSMETKSQGTMAKNIPSNQVGPSNKPPDPGLGMQPQVHNPGQQHTIPLPNQSPSRQQFLSQNIQNNIASQPNLPSVSSLGQSSIQNVGQNSNVQNIAVQNSVGSTIEQNSNMQNMFAASQRQLPGRQQVVPQQQQQHSQNPQQLLFQQQQLLKHKIQQQQQQQNLLQPNQLQPQQSVMQPSAMQTSLSSIQHNQQSNNVQQSQSMLQQHPQVTRQQQQHTSVIHKQQTSVTQQSILPQQQQQQLMGSQANATSMQNSPMLGSQNNGGDMQQPQRLLAQQNNLSNLQQQQLINQQNNLTNMHKQLGNNVSGLQPQQVLGAQTGNSGMQTSQHSAQVPQQTKVPMQQQNTSNLLLSQAQQPQAPQQQLMPQIQSHPAQLQQQLGLQQQPNSLQRDMQQKLQASGSLPQQQSVVDQQKQLYKSQRPIPETSSTSLDSTAQTGQPNGDDWQEEVYQKIKTMKENYLPELNEMYQKVATKLQQHDSLSHQPKTDQLERLKVFKMMLERIITFLQVPKSKILPNFKEKMGSYEKQIINFINTNRPRKAMSSLQPGHLPPSHMHSMSHAQLQVTQAQSHENQMNSQLQTTNMQGSVATMQQNNSMAGMQRNSMSGVSTTQQNMMNSMQPGTNIDSGQGNAMNSMQQVIVSSLQQNPVSAPQQPNINSLSSQGGVNVIQPNLNPLQPGSSMLQHLQLKQQQEQHMLQSQQFKQQYHQRQLIQRQQIIQQQQLHQPAKQQLPAQLQTHQIQQLNQMNDVIDTKMRQETGVKPGALQQHIISNHRSTYPHQPMKQENPFPVSSPQLLQTVSPQMPQHSSPQVDQQNNLPYLTKAATPLQSANSPFVAPIPSPPLAPSPMPRDSEKPFSGVSSLSNAANVGHQQTGGVAVPAQSLAIGTPGISASPILAEFSSPDGAHGNNALAATSGKSTVTEQPIERLIKVVQSMSSKAFSAAVNDIGAVVSMNDRIAGSAPGNGSRVAVGEDLVAMTNCRLQARNFITQDGGSGTRKMKRHINATPLNVISSAGSMTDSIKLLTAFEASELESIMSTSIKKPRIEASHALLEEIKEVNQRLIDTVVDISNEDIDPTAAVIGAEGTVVTCSYTAVALSSSLKSQYASAQMSPIQPLRVLVPTSYPNCSPMFLDKFPVESSKENEDLSMKARSRFSISLRGLSQPMSLGVIARTWDICARAVICEHAQKSGGGSFSSKYGSWEDCLTT